MRDATAAWVLVAARAISRPEIAFLTPDWTWWNGFAKTLNFGNLTSCIIRPPKGFTQLRFAHFLGLCRSSVWGDNSEKRNFSNISWKKVRSSATIYNQPDLMCLTMEIILFFMNLSTRTARPMAPWIISKDKYVWYKQSLKLCKEVLTDKISKSLSASLKHRFEQFRLRVALAKLELLRIIIFFLLLQSFESRACKVRTIEDYNIISWKDFVFQEIWFFYDESVFDIIGDIFLQLLLLVYSGTYYSGSLREVKEVSSWCGRPCRGSGVWKCRVYHVFFIFLNTIPYHDPIWVLKNYQVAM